MNSILRKFWHALCPTLITATLFAAEIHAQGQLTLAAKDKTSYQIVISTDALPSESYAAKELQQYLKKISGVSLPITNDSTRLSKYEIILGDNAHLRRLEKKYDLSKLGTDGFILRTDGNRLIIAGVKPRGTLYGVYELLEQKLGVRWFTPESEFVPQTNRLILSALNETNVPALEYREVYWTEMFRDADFAARHRLNGNHYPLIEKHGGRAAIYYPFVHSMDNLIPPELYVQHPEYFPLIDGKRKNGYVQRCLSNPDVVKMAITRVRPWIKEHPEATIISVSQNDAFDYCQCPTCKALDDAEGSPAASMLKFVNTIAADIEHDFPQVRIDTLAYQYTRKPPKTIRARATVIVRLCSIECCFAHPLETCTSEENHRFRDDILAWEPVAQKLYVWDYTPNFSCYQQPFPNFAALQPNVQFFVKHGVHGLFEQGNYSGGGNGELGPLRAYVLAELLWHPETDPQKHIHEFVDFYYGKAAPQTLAYLQLLQDQVRAPDRHAHIYDPPSAAYLNEPFIQSADALLAQAEKNAENETNRFHVQVMRLPVWYVQLSINHLPAADRAALLARFIEIARKAGISHISEGQSFDAWAKAMK